MRGRGAEQGKRKERREKRVESNRSLFLLCSLRVGHFAPPLSTSHLEPSARKKKTKKTKKNEKFEMHVLGLHRSSGYNIPEGSKGERGAPTRIGRNEITSQQVLKRSFDGGASLALEKEVCEFCPSFFSPAPASASSSSSSPPNPGREASLLTVLNGGVIVVSSSSSSSAAAAAARGGGGGGGGGANEGGATTAAATTTEAPASETTLSPGQTAEVHPGDLLFFPGCPRDLVGLRVLPGAAEKDARELDRQEQEERRKKKRKRRAEEEAAAAAEKEERARAVLLQTPEPFHRWHLSFFNTRFSSQLEQWCRDEGATVTRLLLFDCEKGKKKEEKKVFSSSFFRFVFPFCLFFFFYLPLTPETISTSSPIQGSICEDAYLSLFPQPPLRETYGDGNVDLPLSAAQREEAAKAEAVAEEVRAQEGAFFFEEAQKRLRDAGLPPPPSRSRSPGSSSTSAAGRASAVVIGGAIKTPPPTTTTTTPQRSSSRPTSASAARSSRAAAEGDDEFAEVCEIKVLRLAGLWPPPFWGRLAKEEEEEKEKEKEKKKPPSASNASAAAAAAAASTSAASASTTSTPSSSSSSTPSAAAALLPRSDFPVLLLPRTFVGDAWLCRQRRGASRLGACPWSARSSPPSPRRERLATSSGCGTSSRVCCRPARPTWTGPARPGRQRPPARRAARGSARRRSRWRRRRAPWTSRAGSWFWPSGRPGARGGFGARWRRGGTRRGGRSRDGDSRGGEEEQQEGEGVAAAASADDASSFCSSFCSCSAAAAATTATATAASVARPRSRSCCSCSRFSFPPLPFSAPPPRARTAAARGPHRRRQRQALGPRRGLDRALHPRGGDGDLRADPLTLPQTEGDDRRGSCCGGRRRRRRRRRSRDRRQRRRRRLLLRTTTTTTTTAAATKASPTLTKKKSSCLNLLLLPTAPAPTSPARPALTAWCPHWRKPQGNYALSAAGANNTPEAKSKARFKGFAIGRLIKAVSSCPFPLDKREDVYSRFEALYGDAENLRDRSLAKLWEVVSGRGGENGDLMRNADKRRDARHVALGALTRIAGVGLAKARELLDVHKCTSACDLLTRLTPQQQLQLLSKQQRLGAKHLDDFEQPVPRAEVAVVERAFRVAAARVWKLSLPPAPPSRACCCCCLLLLPLLLRSPARLPFWRCRAGKMGRGHSSKPSGATGAETGRRPETSTFCSLLPLRSRLVSPPACCSGEPRSRRSRRRSRPARRKRQK